MNDVVGYCFYCIFIIAFFYPLAIKIDFSLCLYHIGIEFKHAWCLYYYVGVMIRDFKNMGQRVHKKKKMEDEVNDVTLGITFMFILYTSSRRLPSMHLNTHHQHFCCWLPLCHQHLNCVQWLR